MASKKYPAKKPPVGGTNSLKAAGDYYSGADLGQSKGRSAAAGRRINKTKKDFAGAAASLAANRPSAPKRRKSVIESVGGEIYSGVKTGLTLINPLARHTLPIKPTKKK